jgi:hypothetical protein
MILIALIETRLSDASRLSWKVIRYRRKRATYFSVRANRLHLATDRR